MVELKVLSDEALCVRDNDINKLKGNPEKYRVFHSVLGDIGEAKVIRVLVGDEKEGEELVEYLADVVTGSLYHPETLKCLTGPLELK